jgi:hypothetical protein
MWGCTSTQFEGDGGRWKYEKKRWMKWHTVFMCTKSTCTWPWLNQIVTHLASQLPSPTLHQLCINGHIATCPQHMIMHIAVGIHGSDIEHVKLVMIEKIYTSQIDSCKMNWFVLCDAWMHYDNIIFNKNVQNSPVCFAHFCEILARRQSLACYNFTCVYPWYHRYG